MKTNFFLLLIIALISVSCAATSSMSSGTSGSYSEIAADGRIYVIGSDKLMEKYSNIEAGHAPHLPYTQTYLGLGPNGETVIMEVGKKGTELKERLLATFCKKNGKMEGPCAM
ncbi:MAG: hypothetical protein QNL04_00670 [SAR324 cluster bacterium]|nr:hypothetical protein [SAR324 cluster bacterium]